MIYVGEVSGMAGTMGDVANVDNRYRHFVAGDTLRFD